MMKALLVSLLLISSSAFSYEPSFDSDYCDVDINGGVRISQSKIEFYKNDHLLYQIITNKS